MSHSRVRAASALALASVTVTDCSSAGSPNALPPSDLTPSELTPEIVAAYGSSEQELRKVIQDAASFKKVARFVTVKYGALEHVFSPGALLARTGRALIANGYGHSYVWPIDSVQVQYSGSGSVSLNDIPLVTSPAVDRDVAMATIASHTVRWSNKRSECRDCFLFFARVAQSDAASLTDSRQKASGLLLYSNIFNATQIQECIRLLQSMSNLDPVAWGQGGLLQNNFTE